MKKKKEEGKRGRGCRDCARVAGDGLWASGLLEAPLGWLGSQGWLDLLAMLLVGLGPQVGIPTSRAQKKEKLQLEKPKRWPAMELNTFPAEVDGRARNLIPLENPGLP